MATPVSPASVLAVGGLIGGFGAARYTDRREVGGAVFALLGALCVRTWARTSGRASAAGLGALYLAAMGGSHPLAKRLGPWPSVFAVAGVTAAASEVVTRRGTG